VLEHWPAVLRSVTMREWLLTGPRQLKYVAYEDPPLADNEVRVRSIVTGVKRGTEMTLYRGVGPMHSKTFDLTRRAMVEATGGAPPYPRGLGSWGVGEIIAVGRAVTRYRAGDLVHGNSRHRPTVTYALDAAGDRIGHVGGRHLRRLPPDSTR
jgi:NADPH:quinone reductase-like Zn-dependent oxidoreductase